MMNKAKKNFTIYSLKGSFVFAIFLFVVGIVFQISFGVVPIDKLKFPVNLYIFIELFFITIALWVLLKNRKIIQWLASSQSALAAISLFGLIVIIMAITPQGNSNSKLIDLLGFNKVIYTWMYAFSVSYLLLTLGLVTLRRLLPINIKNIAFFINHFGLWLAMSSGILGYFDKQQLLMPVQLNQLVWYAEDESRELTELPFALKLEKFTVKYHPPKVALMNKEGEPYKVKGDQLVELYEKSNLKILNYEIEVVDYFNDAFFVGDTVFDATGNVGTAVAADVRVSTNGKTITQAWISPGSYMFEGKYIILHPDTILGILSPEPAYYGSEVLLFTKSGVEGQKKTIAVNKPISAEGWTIYQHSYDGRLGKDSPYSVFSIVKDPWLPIVYAGIFLMMFGSLWLIFFRKRNKNNTI